MKATLTAVGRGYAKGKWIVQLETDESVESIVTLKDKDVTLTV